MDKETTIRRYNDKVEEYTKIVSKIEMLAKDAIKAQEDAVVLLTVIETNGWIEPADKRNLLKIKVSEL